MKYKYGSLRDPKKYDLSIISSQKRTPYAE